MDQILQELKNLIIPNFGPQVSEVYSGFTLWYPYVIFYLERILRIWLIVALIYSVLQKAKRKYTLYLLLGIVLLQGGVNEYYRFIAGYPVGPDWPIELYVSYLFVNAALSSVGLALMQLSFWKEEDRGS